MFSSGNTQYTLSPVSSINHSTSKTARDSNGELLRLLAMLMIVAHHWVVHAMYPDVLHLDIAGKSWDHDLMLGLHGFFYIGMNCFLLLSGWYSIRLKVRSVLNLWTICFFYALVNLCAIVVYRLWRGMPCDFSWERLSLVVMPLSHTPCWFVPCYVALMLFSPLLNTGIDHLDRKQYQWIVVCLSVMNLWFGYFCRVKLVNYNGYSMLQFIWLYVLGGFLHRYYPPQWCRRHRWHCLWLYAGSALLWGILSLMKAYHLLPGIFDPLWHAFTYCNPLVMSSTLGFFLFMMSFQFNCKAINWMATSVLAVYLVQESIFPYHRLQSWTENWLPMVKTLAVPLFSVAWVVAVISFDRIRVALNVPFWRYYDGTFSTRLFIDKNLK